MESGKGYSIASMVLGIVSVVIWCFPFVSIPAAVIGLVFGIVSLKKNYDGKGMAIAGIVTSSVALVWGIWVLISLCVNVNISNKEIGLKYFKDMLEQIDEINKFKN